MQCQLCGLSKKLIKAHPIPESFFRQLRDDSGPPRLMTDRPGVFPKRAPIGIYDKTILCGSCEKIFQLWDDYAQLLLIQEFDTANKIEDSGKTLAYVFPRYDYAKLKLFFISVLWRAAVASHSFYAKVRLGPHADRAKKLILEGNPGSVDDFMVVLGRLEGLSGPAIFDPHPFKIDERNYYKFYVGFYVAVIKVDSFPGPDVFRETALGSEEQLLVFPRDIRRAPELSAAKYILKRARE